MNIAVFGGSGFIGTELCKVFSSCKISRFTIFDIVPSILFNQYYKYCDVRKEITLHNSTNYDVIINLAAEHADNVFPLSKYYDTNVDGARNICKLATNLKINKIIFTSTVAIYGLSDKACNEDSPSKPFNDYGKSKLQAEDIYREWYLNDPLNRQLIIIRPAVVFGLNNRGNIYLLLKRIISGFYFIIGNGNNIKSMAYVENISNFIYFHSKINRRGYHLYNYVDLPNISINKFIEIVNSSINRKYPVNVKIPFFLALVIGVCSDFIAKLLRVKLPISRIRVIKFSSNSIIETKFENEMCTKIPLNQAIEKTIFLEFRQ